MIKVTCACIIKDGKILITQRGPESDHPFLWEFPGGKIKAGETAEECIKREIWEELELEIEIVQHMISVQQKYAIKEIELIPFLCSTHSVKLKLNEHLDYKWIEWKDLVEVSFSEADEKLIQQVTNQKILKEYLGKQVNQS